MTPEARGVELQDCDGIENCDPFEDHIVGVFNQNKAMFTAQFMVEDHYGEDFGDLTLNSTVYWTNTRCPKDGQYSVNHNDKCHYGKMWSCDEMYVALSGKDPELTCGSALLHEFGHCMKSKMTQFQSLDADHSDTEFWNVIREAHKISCDRGW